MDQTRRSFGLSFTAMTWHLHNLGYVAQSTVGLLLMTADPTDVSGFEQETRFNGLQRRILECLSRELMTRGRARELLGQPVCMAHSKRSSPMESPGRWRTPFLPSSLAGLEGFAQREPTLLIDGDAEFGLSLGAPVRLRSWGWNASNCLLSA